MEFIKINYETCKACGTCINSCPAQVYDKREDGKPIFARPDDCILCLTCIDNCPTNSISLNE